MLRKIADFVKKIFRMEPIPTTVNTLREALQALEVARNHFEHCDPEFVDADLIMHINSVLMILRQMGVGPQEGFGISDATATWSEFCQNRADIEAVKSYTALKVKMLFDPPQSSSTMEATKNLISELEWRLYAECDREEKQCGC